MDLRCIPYNEVTLASVRAMRKEQGAVLLELPPRHARAFIAMLQCRLDLEQDVVRDASLFSLGVSYIRVIFADTRLRIFHPRLWHVRAELAAIQASPGWEKKNASGNVVFGFIELGNAL